MNEYQATLENTNFTTKRLDIAIELLITTLLVFMPFAFGVRTAFSEEIVIFLSGAVAVCFLLMSVFSRERGIVWTWAYIPIILFLVIITFQLIPLSVSLVNIISPNTSALRKDLLGDLPNADDLLYAFPLSFYPNATKHDLRLVLSIMFVFVVVVSYYHQPDRIRRLLLTIALIGGVVAAVAFAQNIFGNGKIYWFVTDPVSTTLSGPFVNHNHYGQFMNLSVGATLALICVKMHECFAHRKITPSVIYEFLGSRSAKILWLLVIIMVLGVTTIFISLTRGGMVSMIIASAFATLLLTSRPSLKGRGWIMVVMALGAFVCVLYVGFDAVYDRIATINNTEEYSGRLQILDDLTASYRQFPVLGTGLGTHSVVYPMFKQIANTLLYTHAENEYAQVLEEVGIAGLVILIIFGVVVSFNFYRGVRYTKLPVCSAAYGLGFGLVAILVHSFSDFGQHMPANAYLSAIFCALIVSLAIQGKRQNFHVQTVTKFRIPYVLILFGTCGIWLWALNGANDARIAEVHRKMSLDMEKRIKANEWKGEELEYAELISNADSALAYQPDNAKYQYWLNVYRWRSISQEKDPNTGAVIIAEESAPVLRDIIEGFYKACILCPTYGPPYSVVGQIEKFILNEDSGAEKIRKGLRLAPNDPITCLVAGNLDILEGKIQDSIPKLEKAMRLDSGLFAGIVNIYVYQLSRPDLALSAAGDNVGWLNHVATVFDDMQYSDLAEEAREKIKSLLEAQCGDPDTPGSVYAQLGSIYDKQDNIEAAAEYYRQALSREYSQVYWRLELAKLLVKMNKIPEAMNEARICLQLRPQLKPAQSMIADLSVHPAMLAQKNPTP